ncbi:M13-type metalloendopeptidase [Luteibacter sp.]|uniref:M13-type metalloendopeptidase n=1 Tax=Luteibacter sp. TaxID=1886636 RepID=UPI003F8123E2
MHHHPPVSRRAIVALSSLIAAIAAFGVPATTRYGSNGLDTAAMDRSTRPGDDFWAFANGQWARDAAFAPNQEVVGVSADSSALVDGRLRALMVEPSDDALSDVDQRKASDLYASWADQNTIERLGTAPLKPGLARVRHAASAHDLAALFGTAGFASPVTTDIAPSPADPARNEVLLSPGKLGMPTVYYTEPGPVYEATRQQYGAYVREILTLIDIPDAGTRAQAIVDLETRLATFQRGDTSTGDTVIPIGVLGTQLPGLDWSAMLAARHLEAVREVRVTRAQATREIAQWIARTPLRTWQDYLAYRFASDHADLLPRRFAEAHAAFYDRTLYGLKAGRDRDLQGLHIVDSAIPQVISRLYVARYFDPLTQRAVTELFEDVKSAYGDLIERASWMDAPTRAAARAKLAALTACIGGPPDDSRADHDVRDPTIKRDDLFGNVLRSEEVAAIRTAAALTSPVRACTTFGVAQSKNDYYVREENQVLIPAGSMTPPFFDPAAEPAVNYGAIGAVIGHEIGHGFDTDGARFDGKGRVADWWSASVKAAFEARKAAVIAQYGSMEVLPGLSVNGERTLGENMADITGVQAAFLAFGKYQARHGRAPVTGGLTGDQRFFLALAQIRRNVVHEGTLRLLVLTDTHSPSKQRINGTLQNIDAWYDAFHVMPGDRLYLAPDRRNHLW